MGLDMYLTRKSYINRDYVKGKDGEFKWVNPTGFVLEGIPLLKGTGGVKEVSEDAAYWRKSNQIHQWFVDNVQSGGDDCEAHDVGVEQLQELVDACKKVLENHELAEELLPAQEGFFFGGTDYDEYYFQDLESTIKQLEPLIEFEKALENQDTKVWVSYDYRASW